jgi:hypothetical protein
MRRAAAKKPIDLRRSCTTGPVRSAQTSRWRRKSYVRWQPQGPQPRIQQGPIQSDIASTLCTATACTACHGNRDDPLRSAPCRSWLHTARTPPGTGELDFTTPDQLHASMVGVSASGEGCKQFTTMPRVQPGDPKRSLLMLKRLRGRPCGKIMPPAALTALTPDDLEVVRRWIAGCTN